MWLPGVLSFLSSVVYFTVVFATPASWWDAFVLLIFYICFVGSPSMVALDRKEVAKALWGVGVVCVWLLQHPILRAMYGLASLLFSLRLVLLFKGISLSKSVGNYIVFVHSYHDIRLAYRRAREESLKSLGMQGVVWGPVTLVTGFFGQWCVSRCQQTFHLYLLVAGAASLVVYATGSIYLLDIFYRLWLVVAGKDAPCVMQSPWQAKSVSELWSRRWNSTMQQLFKETCFVDPRKPLGVFTIFLTSSLLHVYPLLLLGLPFTFLSLPVVFFLLQGCAVVFERQVPTCRSQVWTYFYILLTASISIAIVL